jgi:hypothetical protein
MNILDENVSERQCDKLRRQRVRVRHIGHDVREKGIKDEEIVPFLHQLTRPTLFTHDIDFYDRRRCHAGYCLVYLDVERADAARFIRRVLRHPLLNTQAKRMGTAVRVSSTGIRLLRRHGDEEVLNWPQ